MTTRRPPPPRTQVRHDDVRILVIGDLHFCERSASIIKPMTEGILKVLKEERPNHVVFLGDSLDGFRKVDTVYQTQAVNFFAECSKLCPCTLLIGNHDIESKNLFMSPMHGFSAFKHYWPITVADTHCVEFAVNGMLFQAVPYCPLGRLEEGLNTIQNKTGEPIATFCHQEIDGCSTGTHVMKGGDKWLTSWGLGVFGHIHHHNMMKDKDGAVYALYTGSPYQDKIDESIDKSISLLTFRKALACPPGFNSVYGRPEYYWREKRIYLGLPVKVQVRLSYEEYKAWEPQDKHIYFLIIRGTASEMLSVDRMQKTKLVKDKGGKITKINTGKADKATPVFDQKPLAKIPTLQQSVHSRVTKDKPYLIDAYHDVFGA